MTEVGSKEWVRPEVVRWQGTENNNKIKWTLEDAPIEARKKHILVTIQALLLDRSPELERLLGASGAVDEANQERAIQIITSDLSKLSKSKHPQKAVHRLIPSTTLSYFPENTRWDLIRQAISPWNIDLSPEKTGEKTPREAADYIRDAINFYINNGTISTNQLYKSGNSSLVPALAKEFGSFKNFRAYLNDSVCLYPKERTDEPKNSKIDNFVKKAQEIAIKTYIETSTLSTPKLQKNGLNLKHLHQLYPDGMDGLKAYVDQNVCLYPQERHDNHELYLKDARHIPPKWTTQIILDQAINIYLEHGYITHSLLQHLGQHNLNTTIERKVGWRKIKTLINGIVSLYPKDRDELAKQYFENPHLQHTKWNEESIFELALNLYLNNRGMYKNLLYKNGISSTGLDKYPGGFEALLEKLADTVSFYPQFVEKSPPKPKKTYSRKTTPGQNQIYKENRRKMFKAPDDDETLNGTWTPPQFHKYPNGRIKWVDSKNTPEENGRLVINNVQAMILDMIPELANLFDPNGKIFAANINFAAKLLIEKLQEDLNDRTIRHTKLNLFSHVDQNSFDIGVYNLVRLAIKPWGLYIQSFGQKEPVAWTKERLLEECLPIFLDRGKVTTNDIHNRFSRFNKPINELFGGIENLREALSAMVCLLPLERHLQAQDFINNPLRSSRKRNLEEIQQEIIDFYLTYGVFSGTAMQKNAHTPLDSWIGQSYPGKFTAARQWLYDTVCLYPQDRHEASFKTYRSISPHSQLLRQMNALRSLGVDKAKTLLSNPNLSYETNDKKFAELYEQYWQNQYPGHTARLVARAIGEMWTKTSTPAVVDLGSGPLVNQRTFAQMNIDGDFINVDLNANSLIIGQEKLEDTGTTINPNNIIYGSFLETGLQSNMADFVISSLTITDTPTPTERDQLLKEGHRLVKPYGKFILTIPVTHLAKEDFALFCDKIRQFGFNLVEQHTGLGKSTDHPDQKFRVWILTLEKTSQPAPDATIADFKFEFEKPKDKKEKSNIDYEVVISTKEAVEHQQFTIDHPYTNSGEIKTQPIDPTAEITRLSSKRFKIIGTDENTLAQFIQNGYRLAYCSVYPGSNQFEAEVYR